MCKLLHTKFQQNSFARGNLFREEKSLPHDLESLRFALQHISPRADMGAPKSVDLILVNMAKCNTYAQSTDSAGNKKSLKSVVLSSKCAILAVQSQMSDSRLSGSFAFGNSFEDLRPSFPAVTESRPHGSFLNS